MTLAVDTKIGPYEFLSPPGSDGAFDVRTQKK